MILSISQSLSHINPGHHFLSSDRMVYLRDGHFLLLYKRLHARRNRERDRLHFHASHR